MYFDLSDKPQTLRASVQAKTDFPFHSLKVIGPELKNSGVQIALNVDLNDVALELPHLEATSLPSILPDKRLSRNAIKGKKSVKKFGWTSHYTPENRFVFFSNLFKDPLSFQLDYRFPSGKQASGKVNLDPMDVTFFRRSFHYAQMVLALLSSHQRSRGSSNCRHTPNLTYLDSGTFLLKIRR